MIIASITSLKSPINFNISAKISAITVIVAKEKTAIRAGLTLLGLVSGKSFFLNKSKLISIPERNISNITPKFDRSDTLLVILIVFNKLLPKIIPVTISATAVGIALILNRAIIIGITRAARLTINRDKSTFFLPYYKIIVIILKKASKNKSALTSQLIFFILLLQK